ncbi:MAG: hypothetical protein PWQ32_412 [Thermococcaceae archaeon]|nr:hypothetical protein [Thermococcaceae archaeon]
MNNIRIFKFLVILYSLLLIASSFVYYYREDIYIRPESYFYLLTLAVGVTFAQIIFFGKNSRSEVKFLIFVEILLITLSFVLTQQALYKTVLGRDPWTHWIFVEEIVRRGSIPPYEQIPIPYVRMPNFHLVIASGIVLTNLSYKWAQVLFAGFPTLILLMFVAFLYSKKLFDHQVGLISILLVAISDNVLDMVGKSIIPNSLGVASAFLIFYLIYFGKSNDFKINIISVLLTIALAFMHTVSLTFLIWQIFVISILSLILKDKSAKFYLAHFAFLVVLALFVWGIYSGFYLKSLVIIFKQLFIYGFDIERYEAKLPTTFLDAVIARSGMVLYFAIAGIITFYLLIKILKRRAFGVKLSSLSSILATMGILAGAVSFLTPALSEIAHRFWYYGEVLSSAFVGSALANLYERKKAVIVFNLIFICALSMLMFKANVANDDNPLVPYYSQRTGWHDSEIEAGKFVISKQGNIPIASDWDYSWNLRYLKTSLMSSGVLEDINRVTPKTFDEVKDCNCLFILRKNLFENRLFYLGGRWTQTPHLPLNNSNLVIRELSGNGGIVYNNNNILIMHLV